MITPHAKQRAFIRCAARMSAAFCASQSGKTIAAAPKVVSRIVRTMQRKKRSIFWLATPTYELAKEAQRNLIAALEAAEVEFATRSWVSGPGVWGEFRIGEAVLEQKSGDHPERLVARPVDGIWVNEGARFREDAWAGNMASRLIATQGWAVFDSSPQGENWFYREIYLHGLAPGHPDIPADMTADPTPLCTPERQVCVHCWASRDNPAVPPEEVERARARLPKWAFAREWEGDPHMFAGQLFPHWSKVNVQPVDLEDYPAVELAADWGFASGHPFVVLVVGVDQHGRRVGVAEEHVHEGMLFEQQIELLAKLAERFPRVRRLTGDSADPGMLAMARARRIGRHVDVVGAIKEAGSVYAGTVAQADLIGEGRYIVDPSCRVTIRQHVNARWKAQPGKPGAVTEEVLRVDDDTVAALRYLVYPRLGRARTKGKK